MLTSVVARLRRATENAKVVKDAERMMVQCGDHAYVAAGEMSWREDAGLIQSRAPGHWHRVQAEIGRRTSAVMPEVLASFRPDRSEFFARL